MSSDTVLEICLLAVGVIVFAVLFFVSAGYGRYASKKWGPALNPKLGWILMECISPLLYFVFYIICDYRSNTVAIVFLCIWELHYVQRAFIYPFFIRSQNKLPVSILLMGAVFNGINAALQGWYLYVHRGPSERAWLLDARFLCGLAVFLGAFALNLHSDHILRNLRAPGEVGYRIPRGGAFRLVSCPNYLGELLEWVGWAVLTWSLSGAIFAFWTAANLVPRARAHHRWYREHFADYPRARKALVPFVF